MASLFWRILIQEGVSDPEGPFRVLRIHMSDTPGGPTLTSDGQAFASSGTAASAFDSGTSVWLSDSGSPQWIGYEFPDPVDIVEVRIDSHNTAGHMSSYPGWFKIQSSDDGIEWEDHGEFRDVIFRTNQTLSFLVDPIRTTTLSFTSMSTFQGPVNKGASAQTGINSYAGDGSIAGQIRINGAPAPGFVSLFDSERGILVGRDETNSIGEYKFENLNRDILYDVIAQDQNREWEKKVSSLRRPVAEDLQFPMSISEGATMEAINWFSDPLWDDVVSLLTFEEGHHSTEIIDEKGIVWTRAGYATVSNDESKSGNGSLYIPGNSSNDYFYAPRGTIRQGEPVTIEAHIFLLDHVSWNGRPVGILGQPGNGGSSDQHILVSGGNLKFGRSANSVGGEFQLEGSIHIPTEEWTHIAFVFDGNEVRLYVNGALDASGANTIGWADNPNPVTLGRHMVPGYAAYAYSMFGYIDNFRVTNAVRYTENFTPPSELPTS